ncbi:putative vesicle transport v-SNARE 11 [Trypanosoma cruzi]|uniref:Vesicle transport v-SNARE 11, putative n=3 Tax=Trypanosoma cruzi TaxID=5693 RepID=Q4DSB4_TRYCC|nr:vesicle transport v-SNARE 11, putative [Trypanosoma cruzi]EAN95430.1 vesicle transport v-SNARE 11, putative [Trypanosoma cruzi]PWU97122.1 putative vesicle transport v-SNARE 11 [Trypanosoma cruzi]RNC57219.1 vesicle transport v-SNARE 11 [Trypanosoma cruzi]|eukprot:XP_817281.1 vesicle transport v-SNARE 11 [Trypanosoma cruzi strain CL Brener]
MSTLFQSYEEEYRDVVKSIREGLDGLRATLKREADGYNAPPATGPASRLQRGAQLVKLTTQLKELLNNMEYECNDVPVVHRPALRERLAECRRGARELEEEIAKTRGECAAADRLDLMGAPEKKGSAPVDARALGLDDETARHRLQMMQNTEKVKQASGTLNRAERLLNETEETGAAVMKNLRTQTETIQRINATTTGVNEEISEVSKILTKMHRTMVKHKSMLIGIILVLVVLIFVALYVSFLKHKKETPVQPSQTPTDAPELPKWGPDSGGGLPVD